MFLPLKTQPAGWINETYTQQPPANSLYASVKISSEFRAFELFTELEKTF
jgi:hypothetical protein